MVRKAHPTSSADSMPSPLSTCGEGMGVRIRSAGGIGGQGGPRAPYSGFTVGGAIRSDSRMSLKAAISAGVGASGFFDSATNTV